MMYSFFQEKLNKLANEESTFYIPKFWKDLQEDITCFGKKFTAEQNALLQSMFEELRSKREELQTIIFWTTFN